MVWRLNVGNLHNTCRSTETSPPAAMADLQTFTLTTLSVGNCLHLSLKRAAFLKLLQLRVFLAWRLSQSIRPLNRLCHSDRRRTARGLACHKKLSPLFQRLLALVKVGMLVVNALHARQLVVQAHL